LLNEKHKATIFVLIAILFGIYCFVFGQSGLLERIRLHKEKSHLEDQIQALQQKHDNLLLQYEDYQAGKYNREAAEKAGYIRKNAKIIFFKNAHEPYSTLISKAKDSKNTDHNNIKLEHLRILWVALSVMSVVFFLIKQKKVTIIDE
jgi:cell division protein FtsB